MKKYIYEKSNGLWYKHRGRLLLPVPNRGGSAARRTLLLVVKRRPPHCAEGVALSFCFPDVSRQLSGLFGSVAQSSVCTIHRAEDVERAEHILTLFDQ